MKAYFLETKFITPELQKIYQDAFDAHGIEIVFKYWEKPEEVIAGAADADCVFSMAIPMNRQVIEALPNLKFIGRCGIGYDSVDLEAATEHGVVVCNVPDYCMSEVALQALTLSLALARQLRAMANWAREGHFGPDYRYDVYRVQDQTYGVIGYGRIGRTLAAMAHGIGMKVIVNDPYVTDTGNPDIKLVSFDELLEQADFVALHMPLTKENYHMIGYEQLKKMKRTAYLINTSRGPMVNTEELVQGLKDGLIAGAGLDTLDPEPLPTDHELFKMNNVIITPHVSLYSKEALVDMHQKLTVQSTDVLEGRWTRNIVNPEVLDKLNLEK
ncbi:MAG: C-terminal binding protein [Eubacterium sp.]|nr:C-terminal binding protein [Eubacterium sp.]